MRLDVYLTENNHIESRTKAKSLIGDSLVMVNGKIITKPSFEVTEEDEVKIIGNNNPYVSRGGLKLEAAINNFNLDFKEKVVLDIGASTGGFTDCALQHGAKLVYAVDVGSDQLHPTLRSNPKVVSMEKTNVKDLGELPNKIDFVVMDVSFVSIEYLLPFIYKYVMDSNYGFVMLIKPQFELGHQKLKNGVVKDSKTHLRVIENIKSELNKYNLGIYNLIPSPILGGDGNKEFLAYVKNGSNDFKIKI
ncbi:MAG: TlyA family RNA methyltransferase [Acholeplasmatales bacterium]|nr:TlyA family RNA methyltransferase [Acholeplasmatales bacterium]